VETKSAGKSGYRCALATHKHQSVYPYDQNKGPTHRPPTNYEFQYNCDRVFDVVYFVSSAVNLAFISQKFHSTI
jgi:hypothetical protein